MKKATLITYLVLCFLLSACSQSVVTPNVTQTPTPIQTLAMEPYEMFYLPDWVMFGMSPSEVQSHYTDKPAIVENGFIVSLLYTYPYKNYDFSLSGFRIDYLFRNSKLFSVMFQFDPDLHFNVTDDYRISLPMLDEYNYIKNALITKYEKPTKSGVLWRDSTYKNKPSKLNNAIAIGHVRLQDTWILNSFKIDLYTVTNITVEYYKSN